MVWLTIKLFCLYGHNVYISQLNNGYDYLEEYNNYFKIINSEITICISIVFIGMSKRINDETF